ncbi:hypothetical protein AX17_001433 [Amanita inopinata Kibby_2008]|nr:hypothetical protein AX17_001433 [Amanita inopinata Kibby_2008]
MTPLPSMDVVFGPPSEPIDVELFLRSARANAADATAIATLAECSVIDLQTSLFNVWNNPRLSFYLSRRHELAIESTLSHPRPTKKGRKMLPTDPDKLLPELVSVQKDLDNVRLESWELQPGSAAFVRTPRNSDYNVLRQAKLSNESPVQPGTQAIVTASVYRRVTWNSNLVSRISQHALLSSQTLGQLFDIIPCPSKEIPREIIQDGDVVGYVPDEPSDNNRGCVICIDGYAYGDGQSGGDYAE